MNVPIIRRGNFYSTSEDLNFYIVAQPDQPQDPMENTIWVNTSIPISSWCFKASEPKTPIEGMVWFVTGNSSSLEFYVSTNNEISLYPTATKQYVSGTWIWRETKSYREGAWTQWYATLYETGNTHSDLTGGWYTAYRNGHNHTYNPSTRLGSHGGDSDYAKDMFFTQNKIDVTGFNKIIATFSNISQWYTGYSGEYGYAIGLRSAKCSSGAMNTSDILRPSGMFSQGYVHNASVTSDGHQLTLDVSNKTGSYYIGVWFGCCTCSCESIRLE